jgi:hypothetical protein
MKDRFIKGAAFELPASVIVVTIDQQQPSYVSIALPEASLSLPAQRRCRISY